MGDDSGRRGRHAPSLADSAVVADDRPKQFCRLLGSDTLLEQTLRRAGRAIAPARTVAVVVRCHERFYAPLLVDIPSHRLVTQPDNRGTAPAILYGLLRLSAFGAEGSVAMFPSDHYISDDETFAGCVGRAFHAVEARPDLVVLLGVVPDRVELGYGQIELGERIGGPVTDLYRVRHFWEKPSAGLLALVKGAVPHLFDQFLSVGPRLTISREDETVRALYARLQPTDFSREVLAKSPAKLAVLRLEGVDWSDLGEPCRVMATLDRIQAQCGVIGGE